MVVLARRVGEQVVVGENIRLMVVAVEGSRIRLGIAAPSSARVQREEIVGWHAASRAGVKSPETAKAAIVGE